MLGAAVIAADLVQGGVRRRSLYDEYIAKTFQRAMQEQGLGDCIEPDSAPIKYLSNAFFVTHMLSCSTGVDARCEEKQSLPVRVIDKFAEDNYIVSELLMPCCSGGRQK